MLIKVLLQNTQGQLIAQNMDTYECICEVDQAPSCEHTVVDDIPTDFMQLLYPEGFGKYLDIATINKIDALREGLTDDEFVSINTLKELEQKKEIKNLTDDLDALTLKFLEKEGVV